MAADNSINIIIDAKDMASAKVSQAADNIRSASSKVTDATKSMGDESDKASSKTEGFSNSLSRMKDMVEGVAVAVGVYKTGQVISEFVTNAFGTAADLEQTNMAFQSLIGNASQASSVFAQLIQYANTTPFQSKDIVQAAQTLMGFGTAGQQTVDIIKQLGDITSTSGGDMNALALVTGQVFSQGKLRAQDMYQVINDGGAGLIKIMAANVGGMKNLTAEFDTGGIPAQQYFDAVNKATANGGFAFEGAQKQANTFNGQLSTLKDTVTQFGMKLIGVKIDPQLGYVIEKGGLFDNAKNIIGDLNKGLQGLNASTVLLGIEGVAGLLGVVAALWIVKGAIAAVKGAWDTAMAIKDGIVTISEKVADWGSTALDAAKTFGGAVADMSKKGATLAGDLGSRAASTSKAWMSAAGDIASTWASKIADVTKTVITEGPKIALHAVDASVAWILNGIRIGIVWAESMAVVVARSTWAAVMATPQALATAAAWVKSAAATSFAWVTVELPKIVRGFITTSVSATSNAVLSSAAWVRNAVLSSAAWVTLELPKIIAGFVATTAAAVVQSALTSAAWVKSAALAATAWVIDQLPIIIAGFGLVAASAVTKAAATTASWVAGAVTSTASWTALMALVSTPLVMPAIVVAAAIASLVLVANAIGAVISAIDAMNNAAQAKANLNTVNQQLKNAAQAAYASGNKAKGDQLMGIANQPDTSASSNWWDTLLTGKSYSVGGYTGSGGVNDVAGVVHKGEYVVPQDQVDQTTGQPKMMGAGITVHQYINNQLDYDRGIKELGFLLRRKAA